MSVFSTFAIYFILWWLALLVIMPFGIRTQSEAGDIEHGTEASAPVNPMIGRKLLAATILAGVAFAVFYAVWVNDIVALDDFEIFAPPSTR